MIQTSRNQMSNPESNSVLKRAVIQLFAKYPHPGFVKTRLIETLGVQRTTDLYVELLERQLGTVCSMPVGIDIELWGTEPGSAPYYQHCQRRWPKIGYQQQIEGDLGQRMAYALEYSMHQYGAVLQTGTDCPALTSYHLHEVLDALSSGPDVVFVPAEDGGYVLAGYRCCISGMFDDIDWGTGEVLRQCESRLQSLGLDVKRLASLWDVDRPEDLSRYYKLIR